MLWRKIYAGNKVGANFSQANQTARKKPRRNNSSTDKSSMRVSRKYLLRHHENCFYCSNVMIADFKHGFAHRVMNVNTRLAKHGNGNGQPNKVCSECSHEGEITKTNFEEGKTGSASSAHTFAEVRDLSRTHKNWYWEDWSITWVTFIQKIQTVLEIMWGGHIALPPPHVQKPKKPTVNRVKTSSVTCSTSWPYSNGHEADGANVNHY